MSDIVRQKKRHWFESHLMVQIAVLFKLSTFLQKCSKVVTEKYTFPAVKNILCFFYFLLSNLVFT